MTKKNTNTILEMMQNDDSYLTKNGYKMLKRERIYQQTGITIDIKTDTAFVNALNRLNLRSK